MHMHEYRAQKSHGRACRWDQQDWQPADMQLRENGKVFTGHVVHRRLLQSEAHDQAEADVVRYVQHDAGRLVVACLPDIQHEAGQERSAKHSSCPVGNDNIKQQAWFATGCVGPEPGAYSIQQ